MSIEETSVKLIKKENPKGETWYVVQVDKHPSEVFLELSNAEEYYHACIDFLATYGSLVKTEVIKGFSFETEILEQKQTPYKN